MAGEQNPGFIYRRVVAQLVKNPPAMQETWVGSLGWEDPLEKGRATHSSILAWRTPWTIQSVGLQRVRHDWVTHFHFHTDSWALQMVLEVKNLPANARDIRDGSSVPGLVRSPVGGHGNPLQYSCLGNSMDRGDWQATVHEVAKSWALCQHANWSDLACIHTDP